MRGLVEHGGRQQDVKQDAGDCRRPLQRNPQQKQDVAEDNDDANVAEDNDDANTHKETLGQQHWERQETRYLIDASHEVIDKCRHRHRRQNAVRRKTTAHEILTAARRACVAAIDNVEIATADNRNASQNSTPLKLRRHIQSLEAKRSSRRLVVHAWQPSTMSRSPLPTIAMRPRTRRR